MIDSYVAALFGSPIVSVLLGLWALSMIALPIVSLGLIRYRAATVTAAVFVQALLVACIVLLSVPTGRALAIIVLVPAFGWGAEFVGSRTGIPFGSYHYTELLQPQIGRVPITIPLAWLMMMPPSWAVAMLILPEGPAVSRALVAAAAFTAWDLYLDPQMVGWGYWTWRRKGAYLGIPVINFIGWFVWAFVISLAVCCLGVAGGADIADVLWVEPLVLIYLTHWLLQFGGHLLFWRMPVSAVVGFLTMGAAAIPAMLRYFLVF